MRTILSIFKNSALMHRKNTILNNVNSNGNNDYTFTLGTETINVAFCETLAGNNCGTSTMATWYNNIDNSCVAYLSGGSPIDDATISYLQANDTTGFPGAV